MSKHLKELDSESDECPNDVGELQNPSSHTHPHRQTSSCGSQYISMSNCNSIVYDNNTHELSEEEQIAQFNATELASYFEQMLYIPKPMSLMAEMMYA